MKGTYNPQFRMGFYYSVTNASNSFYINNLNNFSRDRNMSLGRRTYHFRDVYVHSVEVRLNDLIISEGCCRENL